MKPSDRGGGGARWEVVQGGAGDDVCAISYAVVTFNDSIYLNEALPFNHCLEGNDNILMAP